MWQEIPCIVGYHSISLTLKNLIVLWIFSSVNGCNMPQHFCPAWLEDIPCKRCTGSGKYSPPNMRNSTVKSIIRGWESPWISSDFVFQYHIIPEHLPDDCFPLCDRYYGVPLNFQWRYRQFGRNFWNTSFFRPGKNDSHIRITAAFSRAGWGKSGNKIHLNLRAIGDHLMRCKSAVFCQSERYCVSVSGRTETDGFAGFSGSGPDPI